MKKYSILAAGFIMQLILNTSAQTAKSTIASTQFTEPVPGKMDDLLKGAVEDVSQRTPYSSTWRKKDGKIIVRYSSSIINQTDGEGRLYSSLITGPTSYWTGLSTPSCLYPNFHTDSILITVPAGIHITFFTIDYSYETNSTLPIPKSDGVFYLSTPCAKSDTLSCGDSIPGLCYLVPGSDFSSIFTTCLTPSCNSQSFWLDAHLSRLHGGSGCDTDYVWYSNYLGFPYSFSAYVEGEPIISMTTHITNQADSCNGSAKAIPSGGTAPYTYLWSPNNQTTDSIGGLCAGTYCCTVTDSKGCTDSVCAVVSYNTSGINTINNASSISIYPDPNSGTFTITDVIKGQLIEMYDCTGKKLNTVTAKNTNMQIDISDKANGVYLIRVLNPDGSLSGEKKIIKTQ